jgi:Fic family protein
MLRQWFISVCALLPLYGHAKSPTFFDFVHAYHHNKKDFQHINNTAFLTFIDKLANKKKEQITLEDICRLHHFLYRGISSADAGRLRSKGVRINGMVPPPASRVRVLMNQLLAWLHKAQGHPLRVCSDFHLKFVDIHPFKDGNGRTARTLYAILLLQQGYPAPTFSDEERKPYCSGIHKALVTGNRKLYYKVMLGAVKKSLRNIKGKF